MESEVRSEPRRCAIYTRKSIDLGLEDKFNSLETQRAICSAYIASQEHKAWLELAKHYDDAGRSGATLRRPELETLMADVEAGEIDVVVVYKFDRITRTLLDFVRLMDFFDRHRVSFVSITQNFDTSDSMGRLILNILLTFAQFEREIMADRIRDKYHHIRDAGRWPGGPPPLGYSSKKHVLRIHPAEAETVRFVFERFAVLGSYVAVEEECRALGIRGRPHRECAGRTFTNGTLCSSSISNMLRNPVYIGYLRAGTESVPGLQEPIVSKALWDRAQELRRKRVEGRKRRYSRHTMLCRILFDCFGRLMTIHHGKVRHGKTLEYYASLQNDVCRRNHNSPLWVRADHLEHLVVSAIQEMLADKQLVRTGLLKLGCDEERLAALCKGSPAAAARLPGLGPQDLRNVIRSLVARADLSRDRIDLRVSWRQVERFLAWDGAGTYRLELACVAGRTMAHSLQIPLSLGQGARANRLPIAPRTGTTEPSARLLKIVAEARTAQRLVEDNRTLSLAELAARTRRSLRTFERLLRLNYLAPDIVTAILDGTQPRALTCDMLLNGELPLDWDLQRRQFGFTAQLQQPTRPLAS